MSHGHIARMCPKYGTNWTCFGNMSIRWTHQRGYDHSIGNNGRVRSLRKLFDDKMQRIISDFYKFSPKASIRNNLEALGYCE